MKVTIVDGTNRVEVDRRMLRELVTAGQRAIRERMAKMDCSGDPGSFALARWRCLERAVSTATEILALLSHPGEQK